MACRNLIACRLPFKVIVLVTWRCQARCLMCNIWKRERQNEFSLDEWRMFFQRNSYLQWLTLSGGEPFLRTDIGEIVQSAIDCCPSLYYLNIPTNALSPELVKRAVSKILLLGIPRFVLSVSIDGPPEIHDRIRGVPGAWQCVIDVLQWAKQKEKEMPSRFSVFLEHTLLPDSYGRFDEMVRHVQAHVPSVTAADFAVNVASVSKHYYGNDENSGICGNANTRQALEPALRQILNARGKHTSMRLLHIFPQFFIKMAIKYSRTGIPPLRCRAGRSSIFIDPCGFVYPCISYFRFLGSLRESEYSVEKILLKNDMDQIRGDIDRLKCGGCWTPCEASLSFIENLINPFKLWKMFFSNR